MITINNFLILRMSCLSSNNNVLLIIIRVVQGMRRARLRALVSRRASTQGEPMWAWATYTNTFARVSSAVAAAAMGESPPAPSAPLSVGYEGRTRRRREAPSAAAGHAQRPRNMAEAATA